MKNLLTILLSIFFIKGFATIPTPDFTVSANQSCPYQNITISNTSTITNNIISFNWTFENGIPSTYTGQNPPLIQWEREGEFEIKLEIVYNCAQNDYDDPHLRIGGGSEFESCTSSVSLSKNISIDARCCPNLPIYDQKMLDNGVIVDKVYQVFDDLVIVSGNSLEIVNGSLLMTGQAIHNISTPGGTVSNTPYIYGNTGSYTYMDNGTIKGYCKEMWPGIEFQQDASIEFINSSFKDSYHGIHLELKVGSQGDFSYEFIFHESNFKNNYKSITISENIYANTSYIVKCKFVGDSSTFLSPFNPNDPQNGNEFFKPYYGINFNTLSNISADKFRLNTFQNLLYGIRHTPSHGLGMLQIEES